MREACESLPEGLSKIMFSELSLIKRLPLAENWEKVVSLYTRWDPTYTSDKLVLFLESLEQFRTRLWVATLPASRGEM